MRLRRLVKRLAIVVLVLAVLGVAAFTWFAFWPLEGKVDRLESLVPADVDFVYKASWQEIRGTGWVDRNVLGHPIHPSIEAKGTVDTALAEVRKRLGRINESIPLGALRLDLERDFLSDAVVAAGRFCGGTNPKDGPPTWREILLLLRMTPRLKVDIAALRHGFIQKQAAPDTTIETRAGYLQIVDNTTRPPDPKARGGCEGGFVRPPENVWYLVRVKDALGVTNSEDLAEKVAALGRGEGERAADRPGFELKPTNGGISAVIDVVPLRSYLNRALSGPDADKIAAFLGRFTTIEALDRMNATLEPQGPDGIQAFADVRHIPSDLHPQVRETYALPPKPFADAVARLVPEKDTVAVAQVETPPLNLLNAVYDLLDAGDRRLWEDNVREIAVARAKAGQRGYSSVSEFFQELSERIETTTGIALARLSGVFDQVQYADWFSADDPKPFQAVAIFVRVRGSLGSTPEERRKSVDEFLADRAALLGMSAPRAATRDGIPYSRLDLQVKVRDLEHVKPAYVVFEDRLVISTHEDYLFAILDTMRGGPGAPPSVAASGAFRATVAPLPKDVTVGVYVNAEEFRRLQWDYRNDWVHKNRSDDAHARAFRAKLNLSYGAGGRTISAEDMEKIHDEVDREVERYRTEEYPKFIEEYRRRLDDTARLRSAAFAISAGGDDLLRAGAVLLLNPPGGSAP